MKFNKRTRTYKIKNMQHFQEKKKTKIQLTFNYPDTEDIKKT